MENETKKCVEHKWKFVQIQEYYNEQQYAVFICPECEEQKKILIR